MAPVRVRHPKGVSTIEIDLENATVLDLQREILAISEISPSQQDLKSGYPPTPLTVVPELPFASLGLKKGEQLIVTQRSGTGPPVVPSASSPLVPSKSKSVPRPIPASTAPAPRAARAMPISSEGITEYVDIDGGALVHRVVPDDNSCLFSSVALVFEQDISKAPQIRKVVAEAIRADPRTWSDGILGRPRDEYVNTILKPSAWGGAIELAILATHYATEIASVDVETGRIDRFTPTTTDSASIPASTRCILIYSGIHYDAASLAPTPDAPPDFHQTVFPVVAEADDADPALRAAKELAGKLRAKKAYTNTATFDLKCEICKKGLKGEKEARVHAMETGHAEFGEF